jgi:hypothetical protein
MTQLLLTATVTPSEQNFSREPGRETGEAERWRQGTGSLWNIRDLGIGVWGWECAFPWVAER